MCTTAITAAAGGIRAATTRLHSHTPISARRLSLATSSRTLRAAHSLEPIRILPDASSPIRRPGGGLRASGGRGRAHQKGSRRFNHDAITFAPAQAVTQAVSRSFLSIEAPMEQMPLRLLCRLDAPSVVPPHLIAQCMTYREVVHLCWDLRRVRNMTQARLAEEAGIYPPHVSAILSKTTKHPRELPAGCIRDFEAACGNTAISQWHAMGARLTVVEELQALRA